MNKTELLKLVSDAYDHACEKHPFFAHRPMDVCIVSETRNALEENRWWLKTRIEDESSTGNDILECEVAEAQEAYSIEDYAHCIQELAHCAAVILRMIEKVQEESKL